MTGPNGGFAPLERPAAHSDLTVADRLTREERELVDWLRSARKSGKVGACIVLWNGLVTQVLPTLPPERVGA